MKISMPNEEWRPYVLSVLERDNVIKLKRIHARENKHTGGVNIFCGNTFVGSAKWDTKSEGFIITALDNALFIPYTGDAQNCRNEMKLKSFPTFSRLSRFIRVRIEKSWEREYTVLRMADATKQG